jgi:hypothetical protein
MDKMKTGRDFCEMLLKEFAFGICKTATTGIRLEGCISYC